MHIVMIGPFAWSPKGTVSARAFEIARAMSDAGHQVSLLVPPYDNPTQSGYESVLDGVQIINARLPSWGDSAQARLTVPLTLARRAGRLNPDVIHIFKPLGYAGLAGLNLRLFWPHLPLVLDSDDWEGRGGWADVNPYPRLWRRFFSWQEGWLARRADAVTVASRTLQSQMWAFGLESDHVFYLPNGPSRIYAEQPEMPLEEKQHMRKTLGVGDGPIALYIGHIAYGSELDVIVNALPRVIKAVPGIRVVVIGTGAGLRGFQQQLERDGLVDAVVFTGWVDHRETPPYLSLAEIALFPHRDTLVNRAKSPSKITAYMAMGKPIVASAVGEAMEYLDGGRAGLLVRAGDPRAFADGMIELCQNRARAAELGHRAQERVWQRYDWRRRVGEIERAYRCAIHGTVIDAAG